MHVCPQTVSAYGNLYCGSFRGNEIVKCIRDVVYATERHGVVYATEPDHNVCYVQTDTTVASATILLLFVFVILCGGHATEQIS